MQDITNKSLTEIVDLIKKKEIKSEEVTNAYINNVKKEKSLTHLLQNLLIMLLQNQKILMHNQTMKYCYPEYLWQ